MAKQFTFKFESKLDTLFLRAQVQPLQKMLADLLLISLLKVYQSMDASSLESSKR